MTLTRRALPLLLAGIAASARAAPNDSAIRVGALRFGSLDWELDVMRHHGLDRGFGLEVVQFASGPASQVALQAGSVDIVLQDWLWVSRQRASGGGYEVAPIPSALGAVLVPPGSAITHFGDLRGKRLGVAGGPIDKSWLLLRLYGKQRAGFDPDAACEKTFGPPPLIAAQLDAGRLDAALLYWPFAARGEAQGQRALLPMQDVLAALDLPRDMPMLGYVFPGAWAARMRAPLEAFTQGMAAARAILRDSDAEWQRIAPLTRASSPAELDRLRAYYRSGFPGTWDATKARAAERLFGLLASVGGADLVGDATQLAPGTFWNG